MYKCMHIPIYIYRILYTADPDMCDHPRWRCLFQVAGQCPDIAVHTYIYIYVYIHAYVYLYIYIYIRYCIQQTQTCATILVGGVSCSWQAIVLSVYIYIYICIDTYMNIYIYIYIFIIYSRPRHACVSILVGGVPFGWQAIVLIR